MRKKNISAIVAAFTFAAAGSAFSFPYPNSGSLYRDVRDDSLHRKSERQDVAVEVPSEAASPVQGEPLAVSHFVVYGNSALGDEELTGVLEPFSHQLLTPAQLQLAADTLRREYRSRGLFAAQVYLPPQAIVDGIVTLHVYEGVLEEGGVELHNEGGRVNDETVTAVLAGNLSTGAVMHRSEFERTILLVDDLPGITSHSIIYPGTEPGEARFLMRTEDTPFVTGNVDMDNFGSYYTGEERLGATVYFNSPSGRGDQVTVRAVTSGGDSNYFFLDYSIPVSGSGLRLGGSIDYLDYEIGEELGELGLEGDAASLRLFASYPFVRSRHTNLAGSLEYAYLSLEDDGRTGEQLADRRLHAVTLSIFGDHDDDRWANGENYFAGSVTGGTVDIRGGDAFEAFDSTNIGTDGSFARLNFDLSRLQHLGGAWSAFGGLAGQWASTNLDSSQKFYLGGPFSIPGYPTGELGGDHGARLQVDVRYDLPYLPWGGDLQLSLFYTAGWAQLFDDPWDGWEGDNPVIRNDITLLSWGLACSQVWSEGIVLRSSIGRQIGSNDGRNPVTGEDSDRSDDDYRAWFQAIYYF